MRDFPPSLLEKFPFPAIQELDKNQKKISELKKELSQCLMDCFVPERGRVGEFRTALCKNIIDAVDEFLGKFYGLNEEELKFIKQYDSHIRKA